MASQPTINQHEKEISPMQKTTVLRIAFTLLLVLGSFATPLLADGGGPVPLCPQKTCKPGGGK
jgi:hypothetical protein